MADAYTQVPTKELDELLAKLHAVEQEQDALATVLEFWGPRAGLLLLDRVTEMTIQHKNWSAINEQRADELQQTYRRAEAAEQRAASLEQELELTRVTLREIRAQQQEDFERAASAEALSRRLQAEVDQAKKEKDELSQR